jgi:hypothetical protein
MGINKKVRRFYKRCRSKNYQTTLVSKEIKTLQELKY